jgi:hypothetical protein
MIQTAMPDSRNTIVTAFERLLNDYRQQEFKVATKEEEAEKLKDRELLVKTANYTVNNIINGMAALQLNFAASINELTDRLTTESDKLAEIKKAIAVETENLKQLHQIRLVADALHIFSREHQEKIKCLEIRTATQIEAIEKEMEQTRKIWDKERQEFTLKNQETLKLITQKREQEEADYEYELKRQRKIELDDYLEDRRLQERELKMLELEKTKNWQERQQYLENHRSQFTKNSEKAATFEEKLAEEYNKAKGEAIKEADRKAKIEIDLIEKEWEATKQGNLLKIESLEQTIERQIEQIDRLTTQLEQVNTQAQNLAMQAFQTTGK